MQPVQREQHNSALTNVSVGSLLEEFQSGDVAHTKIGGKEGEFSVSLWARLATLTRQGLRNNPEQLLADISRKLGFSAFRTIEAEVAAALAEMTSELTAALDAAGMHRPHRGCEAASAKTVSLWTIRRHISRLARISRVPVVPSPLLGLELTAISASSFRTGSAPATGTCRSRTNRSAHRWPSSI